MAKFPKEPNTIVQLNAGGAPFTATVKTLTEHSGYFKSLARDSGAKLPALDDGRTYFLVRDPKTFKNLMAFMRTQSFPVEMTAEDVVSGRQCRYMEVSRYRKDR